MYCTGVDVGGTFTDCVPVDQNGNRCAVKSLLARQDLVSDAVAALERLAEAEGIDPAGHSDCRERCAVLERVVRDLAPEYATHPARAEYTVRFREYLCPVTGLWIGCEILREDGQPVHAVLEES